MLQEFHATLTDGVLTLVGTMAPDLPSQTPEFCEAFKNMEATEVKITLDTDKATTRLVLVAMPVDHWRRPGQKETGSQQLVQKESESEQVSHAGKESEVLATSPAGVEPPEESEPAPDLAEEAPETSEEEQEPGEDEPSFPKRKKPAPKPPAKKK